MAVLSLRKARTIIRKTLEHGKEQGFRPLSVVVLDDGGNVKAFEREDDAAPGRFAIAHGKAFGCIMLGILFRFRAVFCFAINGAGLLVLLALPATPPKTTQRQAWPELKPQG